MKKFKMKTKRKRFIFIRMIKWVQRSYYNWCANSCYIRSREMWDSGKYSIQEINSVEREMEKWEDKAEQC